MRHNNSNRRSRKRSSNGNRGGASRSKVYDSNGPDVRIRGTAFQVADKYEALAKDAASSGNTVLAESYLQHAEHYRRIIGEFEDQESTQFGAGAVAQQPNGNKADLSSSDDDLSLPSSILGDDINVDNQAMATA